MTEANNPLGDLLRTLRKERGLSQEDLGNRVGLNRLTISEYELGRVSYPKRETLGKLADGLSVPVSWFLSAAYLEEERTMAEAKEMVNHPDHYNMSEIETFEMFLIQNADRPQKILGALEFNIQKYRDRAQFKNGDEDRRKMMWYLDKFILLFPEEANLYQIYHLNKETVS